MGLDHIREQIKLKRVRIGRQRKDIQALERAGSRRPRPRHCWRACWRVSTSSAPSAIA
jgi:hypothetical protein